uniref:Putative secreted peptide n=1 Tax=Anopheles braziliensis TaxID=58242 RepID=A0A2M3ZV77_9DIPT
MSAGVAFCIVCISAVTPTPGVTPGSACFAFRTISLCISLPFFDLNNWLAASLSFCLIFRKSRSLRLGNRKATYSR